MLRQGLILTSQREYAQAMRLGLLDLGEAGARVDIELDAFRAMQLVPQQYDLILLDAMMASMDGLQLLQLLKQQAPASKFVVVSDVRDETSRAQAYKQGADLFVERPMGPQSMEKVMNDIRGLIRPSKNGAPLHHQTEEAPIARIVDIVQTCCLSGDSVLLLVKAQQNSGDIFIYRGEVFHAQYPGKSGEGAFHDMVHWDNGQVRIKVVKLGNVPPRTIEVDYRQLLDRAEKALNLRPLAGDFLSVSADDPAGGSVPNVVMEAPPLEDNVEMATGEPSLQPDLPAEEGTPLPTVNAHWKVNLMGELVEGSRVSESDRCSFITYFIYRKLADVAVALEVDYFNQLTLFGPHLQQVLVADNMGVRQAVFDAAWATEAKREQYIKWCCEQSF